MDGWMDEVTGGWMTGTSHLPELRLVLGAGEAGLAGA